MTKRKREESLSKGGKNIVYLYYGLTAHQFMSIAQIKNLQRKLDNLSIEANQKLDQACGHELWRNIGFDAFDQLPNASSREQANYYYGQWQTVKEIQEMIG